MKTLTKLNPAVPKMGHMVGLIEGGTFPFSVSFAVLVCRELGEVMVNFMPKYYVNPDGTRVRVGTEVETVQVFDYNTGLDYLADRPHGGVPRVDCGIATDAVIETRIGYILGDKKQTLCLKPEDVCWLAGKISEHGGARMSKPMLPSSGSKSADMVDEYRQLLDIDKAVTKAQHFVDDVVELRRQAMELANLVNDCLNLAQEISETRREVRNLLQN